MKQATKQKPSKPNYWAKLTNQLTWPKLKELFTTYKFLLLITRNAAKLNVNNNLPNYQWEKKQQLQRAIQNLENKPNKTPEEEAELECKQKELNNPQQHQGNKDDNKLGTYVIIALIICLMVGFIYLLVKNQGGNKHAKNYQQH